MEIIDPNPTFSSKQSSCCLQPAPYSKSVLILGIISIVVCWGFVGLGLILEITTLYLGYSGKDKYHINPSAYIKSTYKNLWIGQILAVIGLSLSVLSFIFIILKSLFAGTFLSLFSGYDFIRNLFPKW